MVAGFPGFARPKTALKPGTERGLTSEFPVGGDYLLEDKGLFRVSKANSFGKFNYTFLIQYF